MDDRQPPLALPMPQKVHLHQICNRATSSTSSSSRVGLIINQIVVEVYKPPRRSKSSLTSNLQWSLVLKQQCFAFHTWWMIEDLETFCNKWVRLSSTPTRVHQEFNTLTISCQSCIFASLMFTPCAILVDWGDIIFADVLKLHPSQQTFCCCPSRAGQLTQLLDQG